MREYIAKRVKNIGARYWILSLSSSLALFFLNFGTAAGGFFFPLPGGSQIRWPRGGIADPNVSIDDAIGWICSAGAYIFAILVVLSIIFVLVAAFRYLTSGGEPERVKQATKTLTFAGVALVVALIARGFPLIIATFFGVQNLRQICL